MIVTKCAHCASDVLLPDPEPRTQEQNIQFRKDWDARVEAGFKKLENDA